MKGDVAQHFGFVPVAHADILETDQMVRSRHT